MHVSTAHSTVTYADLISLPVGAGLAGYVVENRLFVIGRVVDMLFASDTSQHVTDIEAALRGLCPGLPHDRFALTLPPPPPPATATDASTNGIALARGREHPALGGARFPSFRRRLQPRSWLQLKRKPSAAGFLGVTPAARSGLPSLGVQSSCPDVQPASSRASSEGRPAASGTGGADKVGAVDAVLVLRRPAEGKAPRRRTMPAGLVPCLGGTAATAEDDEEGLPALAHSLAMLKLVRPAPPRCVCVFPPKHDLLPFFIGMPYKPRPVWQRTHTAPCLHEGNAALRCRSRRPLPADAQGERDSSMARGRPTASDTDGLDGPLGCSMHAAPRCRV